jgi:hypothetical protein
MRAFVIVLFSVLAEHAAHAGTEARTVRVRALDLYPHGAPEAEKRWYRRALEEHRAWVRDNYPHDLKESLRKAFEEQARQGEALARFRAGQKFEKDGKPDTWEIYSSSGELLERTIDSQPWHAPDGKADIIEFHRGGELLVRLTRVGYGQTEISYATIELFEEGRVVKEQADTDLDGVYDNSIYYSGRKGRDYVAESDTNGDGVPDSWGIVRNKKVVRVEEDRNGDGKVDRIVDQPNGLFRDSRHYLDDDYDGVFDTLKEERYAGGTEPIESRTRRLAKDASVPAALFPGQPGRALNAGGHSGDHSDHSGDSH